MNNNFKFHAKSFIKQQKLHLSLQEQGTLYLKCQTDRSLKSRDSSAPGEALALPG